MDVSSLGSQDRSTSGHALRRRLVYRLDEEGRQQKGYVLLLRQCRT